MNIEEAFDSLLPEVELAIQDIFSNSEDDWESGVLGCDESTVGVVSKEETSRMLGVIKIGD